MKRFLPLLLLAALPAIAADPAPGEPPGKAPGLSITERDEIFSRFNHQKHEKGLISNGVFCISCHQVGATGDGGWSKEKLNATFLVPSERVCHQCHAPGEGGLGAGPGVGAAPHRCITCHTSVTAPDSHGPEWIMLHGSDAASNAASCRTCHTRSNCVECHDRREDVAFEVHDRAWMTVHPIAARAAPAGCDTCHVQSECVGCHQSSAGYGRSK